jgi:SPW repeat
MNPKEDSMALQRTLSSHRAWEDWASMGLGLVIVISPWLAQTPDTQVATVNAMTVGALVIFIGALELQFIRRWEEWAEFALGIWLVIAPWVLGYSQLGTLTAMHVVLGVLVAALALLELWQDGGLTDQAA